MLECHILLFSSPHLVEVRERIRINGKPLDKEKFVKYFWQCMDKLEDTLVSTVHISALCRVMLFVCLCTSASLLPLGIL